VILEILAREGLLTDKKCKSIVSKAPEQKRRLTQLKRVKPPRASSGGAVAELLFANSI
jgi:hypothetical protein